MANLISIPYILKILFALFIYVKRGCVCYKARDNGDDDYMENLNVEPHTYLSNKTKNSIKC